MPSGPIRWLFGDHLGPHFVDDLLDEHDGPVLLVESRRVFTRRAFHRQKAHLVLSAMRHRAMSSGRAAGTRGPSGTATPSPRRRIRSR